MLFLAPVTLHAATVYKFGADIIMACRDEPDFESCCLRKASFTAPVPNGVNNNGKITCNNGYRLNGEKCEKLCENSYELIGAECIKCFPNNTEIQHTSKFKINLCEIEKCNDGYTLIDERKEGPYGRYFCIIDCPPGARPNSESPKTMEEKQQWLTSGNSTSVWIAKNTLIMKPGRSQQCFCDAQRREDALADDATKTCKAR